MTINEMIARLQHLQELGAGDFPMYVTMWSDKTCKLEDLPIRKVCASFHDGYSSHSAEMSCIYVDPEVRSNLI